MDRAEHFPSLPLPLGAAEELKSAGVEEQRGLVLRQRMEQFSRQLIANRPVLRAYLLTKLRCREAVEDCLQEVALTVWQKYDAGWDDESFRKYSFATARYKALSWLKKNKPGSLIFIDVELAEQIGERLEHLVNEERGGRGDRLDAVEQCVAGMPARQRELLMARYGPKESGEGLDDLSMRSSRSMSALYKQLERLRTALRKCVEKRLKAV